MGSGANRMDSLGSTQDDYNLYVAADGAAACSTAVSTTAGRAETRGKGRPEHEYSSRTLDNSELGHRQGGPHDNGDVGGGGRTVDTAGLSPITLEYAEELLLQAAQGRCTVIDICSKPKEFPQAGCVYIYHSADQPYAWKDRDGYQWSEILHQMALLTPKSNKMDYFHFYIELPSHHHEGKKRVSPKFRKEAYKLGNLTLVAYIGDSRVVDRAHKQASGRQTVAFAANAKSPQSTRPLNKSGHMDPRSGRVVVSHDRHPDWRGAHPTRSRTVSGSSGRMAAGSRSSSEVTRSASNLGSLTPGSRFARHHFNNNRPLRARSLERLTYSRIDAFREKDLHHLADPDMLAAGLVEQEYLQALVNSSGDRQSFQDLWLLSTNISSGKFVKNVTIYPSLQITLVHPDMTREFENICKILYSERCPGDLNEETIKLFYDMTFQIGNLFVTILTFTNYFYLGSPVMPLACNIHERKFKSSHSLFWARVTCDIPSLTKYRLPIVISEAEPAVHLAVKTQAPNLVQFEGWVHRFKDMDRYMRQKGYGAHAVAYFKACVKYLLMSDSKLEMQDRFRKEFEGIWPKDFVNYFRERILPKSSRLGKWALGDLHIYDDAFFNHAGSPQQRFHMRCNHFERWDTLTVPQLIKAFHLLYTFYVNECSSGKAGQGVFAIHPDLKPLFCEILPENLPYNTCPAPIDIVDYLKLEAERSNEMRSRSSPWQASNHYGQWDPTQDWRQLNDPGRHIGPLIPSHDFANEFEDADLFGGPQAFDIDPRLGGSLEEEDDDRGHVPSPAPGDTGHNSGTHRKLSVIPEVPNEHRGPRGVVFCRPPSLAELAAAKQKASSNGRMDPGHQPLGQREELGLPGLQIIVSDTKDPAALEADMFSHPAVPAPRGISALERLQQHSLDSSVVTEGHYDASFETEDHPNDASFEAGHHHHDLLFEANRQGGAVRNGGQQGQLNETMLPHTSASGVLQPHSMAAEMSSNSLCQSDYNGWVESRENRQQGLMLWKRVRHCVVFGGALVKTQNTTSS